MVARRTIEDVVPPEGKTIRKINIEKKPAIRRAAPRRSTVNSVEEFAENNRISTKKLLQEEEPAPTERRYIVPDHLLRSPQNVSPRRRSFFGWILSICALAAIIFAALSLVFSRATVLVTPRSQTIDTTNLILNAKKEALSTELDYELLTLNYTATTSLEGKLSVGTETRTKGVVTIFNTYSATPQTLVAGTRIQDTKGRVYRIDYQVSVPGYKMVGTTKKAGSVDVRVTAQAPGPEYNMSLSDLTGDFKLPGYIGSPKYTGFYARLKTALAGGASGRKVTVDPSDLEDAEEKLKEEAAAFFEAEAPKLLPVDYVLLKGASRIVFDPRTDIADPSEAVLNVSLKAHYHAAIFRTEDLTNSLASKYIAQFRNIPFTIPELKNLQVSISEPKGFSLEKATALTLKVFGEATLRGSLDTQALSADLAGIKLSESGKIMSKYGAIASADIVLQPLWKRFILPSFPKNPAKIKVEVTDQIAKSDAQN